MPIPAVQVYAMAMPISSARTDWTVEEINALPDDGNRYEVVDGELLVTPAPSDTHQAVVLELALCLSAYVKAFSMQLLIAPSAVTFSSLREVQPDLLVRPLLNGRPARRFADVGRLELAVEVLSPSTTRADRYVKRRLYLSEQVPEYWIVDAAARLAERWRPNDQEPEVLLESLEWRPRPDVEPLVIDLVTLFQTVHGDCAARSA